MLIPDPFYLKNTMYTEYITLPRYLIYDVASMLTDSQHDRNIVNRDIKPQCILLFNDPLHVKLGCFNLATYLPIGGHLSTLCGTPSYVAPEVLAHHTTRRYGKEVDIWSLGVVLYICLCGFPPFSDELKTPEFPHDLSAQIKGALFDYPSPHWDSVRDPACRLAIVRPPSPVIFSDAVQWTSSITCWWSSRQIDSQSGNANAITGCTSRST